MAGSGELAAILDGGSELDAEELADLTQRLHTALLDLDVEALDTAIGGVAPEGAKGAEHMAIGGLVVRFAMKAGVLRSALDTTVGRLGRPRARSVKLTVDDDTLEVTGVSSAGQRQLIEPWVARHADHG